MSAPARVDPLAWLDRALADLDRDDLRRDLRHLTSPAGATIRLAGHDRDVLHLCGNGYLGLAQHPDVVAAAVRATERYGTGTGASRLITGGQRVHEELEHDLAAWKQVEAAVVFSSGYLANLGVLTALAGRGDTIVSDRLNHASIVDGCRLAGAEVRIYDHADAEHAERLLADAPGRRVLVTDGVFSMDGDLAPLPALCDAAERHGASVVVDDAHGTGVIGPDGRGTVATLGCDGRVDAIVGTLSKALGAAGGFVAGSARLATWLRNRARPFVFDTAPPPATVAAAGAALRIAREDPGLRARATDNATRLAAGLTAQGWDVAPPAAAIVPVLVGDNRRSLDVMGRLLAQDVLAVAIRPPSVPAGSARIRATVTAAHTAEDLDRAIAAFAAARG